MIERFLLLAAALAWAQPSAPSVATLKARVISAIDTHERDQALEQLAKTSPVSAQDVAALFDLFSRFPSKDTRKAAMDSLALIPPESPQLEPIFLNYLTQPEPETQLFGINGAFRLRSRQALPLVHKIAERHFSAPDATGITLLSQRNAWWAQYEALSALAQWEKDKTLPLLKAKAEESPAVARLIGRYFWRQAFPDISRWALSEDLAARHKAREASTASIDLDDARATREAMLVLVRNPQADEELRHQFALKVGACSNDEEVSALIAEHDATKDDKMRLLLAAAVFVSRSPKAVPLLTRYARESSDPLSRDGARAQLESMLGADKAKALLADEKMLISK